MLKDKFEYDRRGFLVWKAGINKGKYAGGIKGNGYHYVSVGQTRYLTHRVIWFLHYGYWPELIDHIDQNKLNNKIENLRESNKSANGRNRKTPGVGINQRGNKWRARVSFNMKTIELGSFNTKQDALNAVALKKQELYPINTAPSSPAKGKGLDLEEFGLL